ncbi:MAG: Na+/H+ antiporter subunit D [Thermoanaerobacterales bacterium]|nr:Na+/H+ antiporter subunit D [Thermoanaerobacterales bacterium]
MTALVPLPVLLPLLGAAVSLAAGRSRGVQRAVGVTTLAAVSAVAAALLAHVDGDGPVAVQVGGWPAPVGITLVADRTSVVLLLASVLTMLAVLVFAVGEGGAERTQAGFHPLYLVLAAGVAASFLTGDLFNLFVAFEVMLMASYALITLGGRPAQVRSGMTYVVISLVASTLFLLSLALVYAATGTVNMADLHTEVADLPAGVRSGLAVLLVAVFGIKSAVFPLFFWLPDSYPTAAAPVTAVFAGLLTKIGVYAMIRSQTLLFPPETRPAGLLLVVAGLTMVVGVLGAVAQNDVRRLLSFHIVSQIGYMVMGLGLFTVAGLAAAVYFIVHQIVVKTSLFLVAGVVERRTGTGHLDRLSGLARVEPLLAGLFLLAALSLAGIPPLSGFVGKLGLVEAGLDAGSYAIVAVSLAVSLLTLFSMTKIWSNAFWGPPPEPEANGTEGGPPGRRLMLAATGALVALSLAVAVGAGPLYGLAERAGHDLVDPTTYLEAVLAP